MRRVAMAHNPEIVEKCLANTQRFVEEIINKAGAHTRVSAEEIMTKLRKKVQEEQRTSQQERTTETSSEDDMMEDSVRKKLEAICNGSQEYPVTSSNDLASRIIECEVEQLPGKQDNDIAEAMATSKVASAESPQQSAKVLDDWLKHGDSGERKDEETDTLYHTNAGVKKTIDEEMARVRQPSGNIMADFTRFRILSQAFGGLDDDTASEDHSDSESEEVSDGLEDALQRLKDRLIERGVTEERADELSNLARVRRQELLNSTTKEQPAPLADFEERMTDIKTKGALLGLSAIRAPELTNEDDLSLHDLILQSRDAKRRLDEVLGGAQSDTGKFGMQGKTSEKNHESDKEGLAPVSIEVTKDADKAQMDVTKNFEVECKQHIVDLTSRRPDAEATSPANHIKNMSEDAIKRLTSRLLRLREESQALQKKIQKRRAQIERLKEQPKEVGNAPPPPVIVPGKVPPPPPIFQWKAQAPWPHILTCYKEKKALVEKLTVPELQTYGQKEGWKEEHVRLLVRERVVYEAEKLVKEWERKLWETQYRIQEVEDEIQCENKLLESATEVANCADCDKIFRKKDYVKPSVPKVPWVPIPASQKCLCKHCKRPLASIVAYDDQHLIPVQISADIVCRHCDVKFEMDPFVMYSCSIAITGSFDVEHRPTRYPGKRKSQRVVACDLCNKQLGYGTVKVDVCRQRIESLLDQSLRETSRAPIFGYDLVCLGCRKNYGLCLECQGEDRRMGKWRHLKTTAINPTMQVCDAMHFQPRKHLMKVKILELSDRITREERARLLYECYVLKVERIEGMRSDIRVGEFWSHSWTTIHPYLTAPR